MADEGYALSDRSKFTHTLDSSVYGYDTLSSSRDVLKIEINYSNRCHILDPIESQGTYALHQEVNVRRLADEELIGSKISALIGRTTPRDVYDVNGLFKAGKIINYELIKKCAVFYAILGRDSPINFKELLNTCYERMQALEYHKIRGTLLPMLRKGEKINIEEMSLFVITELRKMFILQEEELAFIDRFNNKAYEPELLFSSMNINDISNHPMAIWKTKRTG